MKSFLIDPWSTVIGVNEQIAEQIGTNKLKIITNILCSKTEMCMIPHYEYKSLC